LINAATEEALCLNCHGTAGTGATANVEDGVQYALTAGPGRGSIVGALRNGGFDFARMDNDSPVRVTYLRTATDASFRAKVPVAAAGAAVTSSHLSGAKGIAWGNGAAGAAAGNASGSVLECTSCHNPHGNGQYRILNTLPSTAGNGFVDPVVINVTAYPTTNRFKTASSHGFVVGDIVTVTVAGSTPAFSGQYIIKSIPTGDTFTVAAAPTKTSADIVGSAITITAGGAGTVKRYAAIVDDAPAPGAGDERNYTVQQVRGFQGNDVSYILYASNLASAASGSAYTLVADIVGLTATNDRFTTSLVHGFAVGDTVTIAGTAEGTGACTIATIPSTTTFTCTGVDILADATAGSTSYANRALRLGTVTKSVSGTFNATAGDYFHRTVPWNPADVNAACPNNAFVDSTLNPELASACSTGMDAPNGHPATVTSTITVNGTALYPSAYGQIAFNDQISAWCSTCHSRYYSSTNPGTVAQGTSSAQSSKTLGVVVAATDTITIVAHGYSDGDIVQFTGTPGTNLPTGITAGTNYYVVAKATDTFKVSATAEGTPVDLTDAATGGTVIRVAQASASSWWYSRPGDNTYKYQHQTTTNRSCVTCHVSHGTTAAMPGTFSGSFTYPDGSAGTGATNSRLLKMDNRGTCQMCHDPTGTMVANPGAVLGNAPANVVP
jgi:cytochrome c553